MGNESNIEFNEISFQKGKMFETFIEHDIFPASNFDIIHKTHDYDQNSKRYVESSLKPDFLFRCKVSNLEFYVDAKYRSKLFTGDKFTILKDSQLRRFIEIDTTERPVLVALGIGMQPNHPETISLIPISKFRQINDINVIVEDFKIPKGVLNYPEYCRRINSKKNITELNVGTFVNDDRKKEKTKSKKGALFVIGLVSVFAIALITIFFFSKTQYSNSEEFIKNNITAFYQDISSNDLNKILYHLNDKIEKWYGLNNPTLSQVGRDINNYSSKYPYKKITILWETFKYSKLNNGYFETEYMLDYSVKEKVELRYKTFLLKVRAVWTEDMKLVSISEVIYKKK
jgi:hypothetical protein